MGRYGQPAGRAARLRTGRRAVHDLRPAARNRSYRRTLHRLLPPLPALRTRLVAASALAVAFVALTMALAAGALNMLDKQVLQAMASLWSEPLHPLFQAIAELARLAAPPLFMVALPPSLT